MHDFEAANSDELELKRGDMVLVVPTALLEDQVSNTCWQRNIALNVKQLYIILRFCETISDFMLWSGTWLQWSDKMISQIVTDQFYI